MTIARVWTAVVAPGRIDEYRAHFDRHVRPALGAIDGYLGASLVARDVPDGTAVIVTTRWVSLAAVAAFAGREIDHAVVADDVVPLFVRWDSRVWHYEVLCDDAAPQGRASGAA